MFPGIKLTTRCDFFFNYSPLAIDTDMFVSLIIYLFVLFFSRNSVFSREMNVHRVAVVLLPLVPAQLNYHILDTKHPDRSTPGTTTD